MNKNLTSINVLLDRSGSMASIWDDVIGGFNAFIGDQKKDKNGKVLVSLVQFDHAYEENYVNLPIEEVKDLNRDSYVPRGSTALLDATGRLVNNLGANLQALKEEDRPGRVIVVIFTDGAENASHEFSSETVKSMVKHQEEKYNWKFIFLGANINAFEGAGNIGIGHLNTAQFAGTSKGIRSAYLNMSKAVHNYRSMDHTTYRTSNADLGRSISENEIDGTDFEEKK